ncbi:MAG: hypothetical protein H6569_01325 [Lewinellaceae bacterium]|nr:hypothetical protein [Lewinellaceae bacterium]
MGTFKYRRLCDVNFQHAYFDNGYCARPVVRPVSDLHIFPAAETDKLFRRHALRITSNRANSISIYGEVEKGADNLERLARPLNDTGKWVFVVSERNPSYRLLSDAPLTPAPAACLYLTNATGDAAAAADALHLTKGAGVVDWQQDLVSLHTAPTFQFVHNGPLDRTEALLKLKNSTTERQATKVVPSGNTNQAVFDLQNAVSGLYTLWVKGGELQTFYYLNAGNTGNTPLAVIELYWNDPATDNYRWQNADGGLRNTAPTYETGFATRRSIWKYQIVFKHLNETDMLPLGILRGVVSELKISSSVAGETFNLEQETDNRQFIVTAQQPLDWQEGTQRIIGLDYKLNDDLKHREHLPKPVPDSLRTDPQTNQLIASISLHL